MVRVMMYRTANAYHAQAGKEPQEVEQNGADSANTGNDQCYRNKKERHHGYGLPLYSVMAVLGNIILFKKGVDVLFQRIVETFAVLGCKTHYIKLAHLLLY